jgi:hypothetical protein
VIKVGVAGGVALYLFCVILAAAGFTAIVPLVVLVPVLVLLVGGGNMLGGRNHGRTRAAVPPGFNPAPLSSSGPNGPRPKARTDGEPDDPHRAGGENATEAGDATDAAGTEDAAPAEDAPRTEGGGGPGDHG